jgi:PAS domain S-box-containing protein
MNNFFNTDHMSSEELQNRLAQHRRSVAARSRHMSMPDPRQAAANAANAQAQMNAMADTQMQTGDSLDDIISNNQNELHMRRNSMSHPGYPNAVSNTTRQQEPVSAGGQPMNMMNFSGYQQFGQLNTSPTDNGTGNFGNMEEAMEAAMRGNVATSAFAQPNMLAMANQNDYGSMGADMMGSMMNFSNLNMGPMTTDPTDLDMFGSPHLDQPHNAGLDPLSTNFSLDMDNDQGQMGSVDSAMTGIKMDMDSEMMSAQQVFNDPLQRRGPQKQHHLPPGRVPTINTQLQQQLQNAAPLTSPGHPNLVMRQQTQAPASAPAVSGAQNPLSALPTPSVVANQVPMSTPGVPTPAVSDITKSKSLYSKSGFDMMRALWYVATRKNAEVQLGAVDMSCAFVVCDVTLNDCPIIYVSDNFQNLTGYSRHEIVGQNCRFLQAPDGRVEAGSKREFVENSAVFNLKKKIAEGKEVQQSLINYRKGGKPFLNLLTMIPIPWDTDDVRYFVGFQIDLVECPDAISGQEMGGVQVNYKHSDIGQYIWNPPAAVQLDRESGQTLSGDDVSTLLQQFNPKGVAGDWHKQTWDKMLLENADDVVHVLSLKGLFMYLSPSCKRVLE